MDVNLHAFLMADRVIREDNGKVGIIGSFDRFNFPGFPAMSGPWFVFLHMDNFAIGDHGFVLNLVLKTTGQTVFSGGGKFKVEQPGQGAQFGVPIPPTKFDSEGKYVLSLIVDGQELGERILEVNLQPPQGG